MAMNIQFSDFARTSSDMYGRTSQLEKAARNVGSSLEKAEDAYLRVAQDPNASQGDLLAAEQKMKRMERVFESLSRMMQYIHETSMRVIQQLRVS